jgi:hypothetical protein
MVSLDGQRRLVPCSVVESFERVARLGEEQVPAKRLNASSRGRQGCCFPACPRSNLLAPEQNPYSRGNSRPFGPILSKSGPGVLRRDLQGFMEMKGEDLSD